jgi:beta-ketoacyl-acyl-carrier-protein synthase II
MTPAPPGDERDARRRVVVTGLGAVTPVGNDVPSTWEALLAGRSGIGRLTLLDASKYEVDVGAEVKGFEPRGVSPKEARRMDRYAQFGVAAALEAVDDAGLAKELPLDESAGVVFGCGAGGYTLVEEQSRILRESGPRRVSPFLLTNMIPDAVSGNIAILTGAMGPNMAVVAACATGTAAIGEATEVIRRGDAALMIAGGAEAPITEILYAAFSAMRAIGISEPIEESCRPFDARRNGFVVGEGAGALVLESLEHALSRGARIYAEVEGYGSSNDAFDMVASEESGRGPALAMGMALRKAALAPELVGYINAHGTGTPLNDRVETVAVKRVFGEHARALAISSTKSMTGHMMGAAGAAEAVFTVLALEHQALPPTMHYAQPDPDCDLDYVPNKARPVSGLDYAMSSSIGLGGHNAALIFRRWS